MGIAGISIWQMLIVLIILLPIYFLPIIIALIKNHHYKTPIILINIFGGLLWGMGWFVAKSKHLACTTLEKEIQ